MLLEQGFQSTELDRKIVVVHIYNSSVWKQYLVNYGTNFPETMLEWTLRKEVAISI